MNWIKNILIPPTDEPQENALLVKEEHPILDDDDDDTPTPPDTADVRTQIMRCVDCMLLKYRGLWIPLHVLEDLLISNKFIEQHPSVFHKTRTETVTITQKLDATSPAILQKTMDDLFKQLNTKFPDNVWLYWCKIQDVKSNYIHSLELRTDTPKCEWTPVWPSFVYNSTSPDRLYNFTSMAAKLQRRLLARSNAPEEVNRNRLWGLFVAGWEPMKHAKDIPGDDTYVLLERSIESIVFLETMRGCVLKEHVKRELDACPLFRDRTHFKINKGVLEEIVHQASEILKLTKIPDLAFHVRRFDGQPWVEEGKTFEFVMEFKVSLCYRSF
jgi:hypothetical protein